MQEENSCSIDLPCRKYFKYVTNTTCLKTRLFLHLILFVSDFLIFTAATSPSTAVVGISVGVPILLLLTVAIVFILWRKKRRGIVQQPVKVEDNALYGTYGVAGDQNDYSTVEDTNDYYFG